MRKEIRFLIQLLFGLVLLLIWLRFVEWDLLLSYLRQVDFKFIALMFILGLGSWVFRVARFKLVLKPLVDVPPASIFVISLAANLFNFLLAMRAGELTKGYYLKKLYGSSFVKATSAVVVDRIVDFLILVFIILLIGTFGYRGYFFFPLLLAVFFLPLLMLYLLAWKGTRLFSFFESLMLRFNLPYQDKILPFFDNLIKGFSVAKRSPKTLFLILALTFALVMIDAVAFLLLFLAFGIKITFASALLTVSLLALTFLLPSAPAYIGTVEVAGSAIFILVLGIEKNLAASIALFFHAYSAFVVGILGLPALAILHLRLLKHGKG